MRPLLAFYTNASPFSEINASPFRPKINASPISRPITYYQLAAYADQKDLVNFVARMRVKRGQIRVVHGDAEAKAELQRKLAAVAPGAEVIIPA